MSKEKRISKKKDGKQDGKLYATNNILALSLKHYDMTLQKEAKLMGKEEEVNLQYERLDREEQELLIAVMVVGCVYVNKDDTLRAEFDLMDIINFLHLEKSGTNYEKIRNILKNLISKKIEKIITKKTAEGKKYIHETYTTNIVASVKTTKRDDNVLFTLTKFEDFRRVKLIVEFSKMFSEILLHDNRIKFFERNKHIIRAIQKQPTYVRDIINYMIPIMGDVELDLSNVIEDIYENRNTAKTAKQKLIKAYKEKEEVRNLFLLCGLKIDADNQKIVKRVKGLKDKNGKKVDPAFYLADSVY